MTRTLLQMAEEAGGITSRSGLTLFRQEQLEAFAQLIRAEQREKDAVVCLQQDGIHDAIYADAIRNS